jgi:hypothetical protein
MRLHDVDSGPEFGFVSMTPIDGETMAVFWLDGRDSQGHDGGRMQLRSAELRRTGGPTAVVVVDPQTCDCCQTSAVTRDGEPWVVYRDRSEAEVRDIFIAGPSHPPVAVYRDDWKIAGCPVNGPSARARKDAVAVAWYVGGEPHGRVQVAFAAGDRFGPAFVVDQGQAHGRVALELLDDTRAVVSWLEGDATDPGSGHILARIVDRDGTLGPPYEVATMSASRASGFVRTALVHDTVLWSWTDVGQQGELHVRLASTRTANLGAGQPSATR